MTDIAEMFSRARRAEDLPHWSGGTGARMFSAGRVPSRIGAGARVVGILESDGEVVIDGTVEGEIVAPRVSIGESGRVDGSIFAEQVYVAGSMRGPIEAMVVTVAATGRVFDHVTHNTLNIEPGGRIDGRRPWRPPNFLDGRRPWGKP
ncbi:MAG: polymer-forming cytoskeletal protein [Alphaproteobacteria bacterium]